MRKRNEKEWVTLLLSIEEQRDRISPMSPKIFPAMIFQSISYLVSWSHRRITPTISLDGQHCHDKIVQ